jgi:putative IMPACT (imprinted ancient) family translation regulator
MSEIEIQELQNQIVESIQDYFDAYDLQTGNTMKEYIEYVKEHILSLEQDMADTKQQLLDCDEDYEDTLIESILILDGQLQSSNHLLKIAQETLKK